MIGPSTPSAAWAGRSDLRTWRPLGQPGPPQGVAQQLGIGGREAHRKTPLMLALDREGGIELQGLGDRGAGLVDLVQLRAGLPQESSLAATVSPLV